MLIYDYRYLLVILYLIAINATTFCAFFWDKNRAIQNGWRVQESTLLFLSFLGGSPGAKWTQQSLRHKTRKQPFGRSLNIIVGFHITMIVAAVIPILGTI